MLIASGKIDKGWQVAVSVEADMQLGSPLGPLVFGPRKQGERQLHQRGIQQVDLAFQLESLVARRQILTATKQPFEQLLVEDVWLFFVAASQCRPAENLDPEVVELVALHTEVVS